MRGHGQAMGRTMLQTRGGLPSPAAALGSGLPLETGLLPSGRPSVCPRTGGHRSRSEPERHLQTTPANQCLPPDPRPPRAVPRPCRDLVVGGPRRSTSLKHKCKLKAHIGYKSRNQLSAPALLPCAGSALASQHGSPWPRVLIYI